MSATGETLFRRLAANAAGRGDRIAIRQKRFGIWHATNWRQWSQRVQECALGLRDDGLRPGEHVAILSGNCAEWLLAQLGIALAGGVPVAPHVGDTADTLATQLAQANCVMALCENQEQLDHLLLVRERVPALRRILLFDSRGLREYSQLGLGDFAAVLAQGAAVLAAQPAAAKALLESCAADAPLLIAFSAGVIDAPHMLTYGHDAALRAADAFAERADLHEDAEIMSVLPLGCAVEQAISLHLATTIGACVNFAESSRTMLDDIREIAPSVFVAPPRVWEGLHKQLAVGAAQSGGFRGRLINRVISATTESRSPLLDFTVLRPLRKFLGLSRGRLLASTGGMPALETLSSFRRMGLPVRNIYSLAEIGIATLPDENIDPACVGEPLAFLTSEIAAQGELRLQLAGEWLASGDLAERDGAGLRIIGRVGDRQRDAAIEAMLRASPYVRAAVIVPDASGRRVVLLQADAATLGAWANARNLPYTTYESLIAMAEVRELFSSIIRSLNSELASEKRVAAMGLLSTPLEAARGELTPMLTVRRNRVAERYTNLLAAAQTV